MIYEKQNKQKKKTYIKGNLLPSQFRKYIYIYIYMTAITPTHRIYI